MSKTVEDAEDHEIFDINDFTTACDWERFIVRLEETINEWKLNNSLNHQEEDNDRNVTFENGEWIEKSEIIQFNDDTTTFTITYYSLIKRNIDQQQELLTKEEKEEILSVSTTNNKTYEESIDFDSYSSTNLASVLTNNESSFNNLSNSLPPRSMADLLSKTNDFKVNNFTRSIETPLLAYWYGLRQFVTISPTRENYAIEKESKANLLLSSASCAINNSGCLIPIFVRVHAKQREMFIGICEGTFLKTQFQIIHFNYTPSQYAYLSGLLEIFKSKLGSHLLNSSLLITISIRFTYAIQENNKLIDSLMIHQQQQQPYSYLNTEEKSTGSDSSFDLKSFDQETDDLFSIVKYLPFGTNQDCIDSIYLLCIWSNLSEDIIVDNETYSDLNPTHSNEWSLILNNNIDKCDFKLINSLNKFIDESKKTISVNQLIGGTMMTASNSIDDDLKQSSLKKLTSSNLRVLDISSNMIETAAIKMKNLQLNNNEINQQLPLDKKFLDFIMQYLFPDVNNDHERNHQTSNEQQLTDQQFYLNKKKKEFFKKLNLIKSSTSDLNGLLNRLAVCVCSLNYLGGIKALAQVWSDFLLELRFRYENNIQIPDLNDYCHKTAKQHKSKQNQNSTVDELIQPPDLSKCLLHQKLQMLNCCIKKRLQRQKIELNNCKFKLSIVNANSQQKQQQNDDNEEEDDDDDEFYDCDDDDAIKPDGRLKIFNNLYLLNKPNQPLYVPITQESTPMTEDMLEQHASVLVNLGQSDDASLLRAKIQSASLLSDMQSFKAANPDCILEDFVRWYSPRDWIEIEEKQQIINDSSNTTEEITIKKYELSNRMKIPGNIWSEVWSNAKPIPARKQKRLFDDTKEAENVFEWLNSLTINKIIEHLMPCLLHTAILKCYDESIKLDLNYILETSLDLLIEKSIKITRNNSEPKKYQELMQHIKPIEQLTSLMKAINIKFIENNKHLINSDNENQINEFLKNLLNSSFSSDNNEIKIPNTNSSHSSIGKLILKMFKNNNNNNKNNIQFDKPLNREYILRASASRPAPYSRQSPQRMYCSITNSEFRLAGAFTEDTLFF